MFTIVNIELYLAIGTHKVISSGQITLLKAKDWTNNLSGSVVMESITKPVFILLGVIGFHTTTQLKSIHYCHQIRFIIL